MREHVVIVGGSSGMGRALAAELVAQGSEVTVAGRSADKLDDVRRELGVRTVAMDVGVEQDIERLFAVTGTVSHIVTTAADVGGAYQPIAAYDVCAARSAVDSKLLGPLLLAKHGAPLLEPGGSIVFTSGIAAYRAISGRPHNGRHTTSGVAARREPRLIASRRTSRAERSWEWLMLMSLSLIRSPSRRRASS